MGNKHGRGQLATSSSYCSARGLRESQQDRFTVANTLAFDVYAVFDGHGGEQCVEFVSKELNERTRALLEAGGSLPSNKELVQLFCEVDREYLDQCRQDRDRSGTTACMCIVDKMSGRLVVANTGDTRCVAARGTVVEQLTVDHKPGAEMKRIEQAGGKVFGGRLDGSIAVSRSFGDFWFKVDQLRTVKDLRDLSLTPAPHVASFKLRADCEFVLLASDGLWDVVSNEAAVSFVREYLREGPVGPRAAQEESVSSATSPHRVTVLETQPPPAPVLLSDSVPGPPPPVAPVSAQLSAPAPADTPQANAPRKFGDDVVSSSQFDSHHVAGVAESLARHAFELGSADNITVMVVFLNDQASEPKPN